MADTSNLSSYLKDLADAIRTKKETTEQIPAANFDTEILSIQTNENLDDVLGEQTEIINQLSDILKTKTKSPATPDVFVQKEEPDVKNGVWLNSDKSFNKIDILTNYQETEEWQEAQKISDMSGINVSNMLTCNNTVYLITNSTIYSYDVKNNIVNAVISDLNIQQSFIYNDTIYYINSEYLSETSEYNHRIYKVEGISSSEIYTFTNGGGDIQRICVVEDLLYMFKQKKIYTYSFLTEEFNTINVTLEPPFSYFNSGNALYYNGYIYLMGNNNSSNATQSYKFDVNLQTLTKLTNVPYSCYGCVECLIGNKIYIMGSNNANAYKKFYIYDIETDTYEQQDDVVYEVYSGCGLYVDNTLLVYSNRNQYLQKLAFSTNLVYDENTVCIIDGNTYKTKLLNYDEAKISGDLLYKFDDVKYFDTTTGIDDSISTYYGDGEKWVKFKN